MKRLRLVRRLILPGSVLLAGIFVFLLIPRDLSMGPAPVRRPVAVEPAAVSRASVPFAGQPPASTRDETSRASIPANPAVAGMVVGLDPETGTWGAPTAEQLRELAAIRKLSAAERRAVAKPDGPLPEIHHPDGHVSVELDGQFQEFTTVRLGPDGKPVFTCVQGAEDAARVLAEPAQPALEER